MHKACYVFYKNKTIYIYKFYELIYVNWDDNIYVEG